MNEQNDPLLLDHEADGIQELDNFLPRWWLWLFYLSIVFAFVYLGYYHIFGAGDLARAAYEKEMAAAVATYGDRETTTAATTAPEEMAGAASAAAMEPSLDEASLARGKTVFTTHCVACHGQHGEGLVGPNFCDDHFIHGPNFADSVHIVEVGVPAKGMISWKPVLKPEEIQAVCSYIWTLRGTNPPNPKAPEGEQHAI